MVGMSPSWKLTPRYKKNWICTSNLITFSISTSMITKTPNLHSTSCLSQIWSKESYTPRNPCLIIKVKANHMEWPISTTRIKWVETTITHWRGNKTQLNQRIRENWQLQRINITDQTHFKSHHLQTEWTRLRRNQVWQSLMINVNRLKLLPIVFLQTFLIKKQRKHNISSPNPQSLQRYHQIMEVRKWSVISRRAIRSLHCLHKFKRNKVLNRKTNRVVHLV